MGNDDTDFGDSYDYSDHYDHYENFDYVDQPDHRDDRASPKELEETFRRIAEAKARRSREEAAEPSLDPFSSGWDSITFSQVELFRRTLDEASREQDMQELFEAHPILLVQPLGGGHGRWVIPQKRLGAEFVPDFMIAEKSSIGFEWTAVELESPKALMFTKHGEFSAHANHAMRQVEDWRVWLGRNRETMPFDPATRAG